MSNSRPKLRIIRAAKFDRLAGSEAKLGRAHAARAKTIKRTISTGASIRTAMVPVGLDSTMIAMTDQAMQENAGANPEFAIFA
jgi:hypothetical protein